MATRVVMRDGWTLQTDDFGAPFLFVETVGLHAFTSAAVGGPKLAMSFVEIPPDVWAAFLVALDRYNLGIRGEA